MRNTRTLSVAVVAVVIATTAIACDNAGDVSDRGVARPEVSDRSSGEPAEIVPPLSPGPARLAVRRHTFATVKTSLVHIPGGSFDIVTVNGRTAYRFEHDRTEPPTVRCTDDCVITWPPVIVDSPAESTAGIAARLVGTAKRPDGHRQLTYAGWPLYWFIEDTVTGDARGEGFGDSWSTIGPSGNAVFAKPQLW